MSDHSNSSRMIQLLSPDGLFIRGLRYTMAAVFLFFAVSKVAGMETSTQWLGDIQLAGVTIWAIALIQFIAAVFLIWRTTFPIGAWFIIAYSVVLMWIHFSVSGGVLLSGFVIITLATLLTISDRLELE